MRDYWGPNPNFRDRQFERVFRITRVIADRLLNVLGNEDPFFTQRFDGLGKLGICPKVKLLFALKLIAYGISPSGFQSYFQMGLPTARQCLMRFIFVVSNSVELQEHYMRPITRQDALRVSNMHKQKHGISGMLGSLDCMHVWWKNCPNA
jgi:hypothetical protein